MEAKEKARFNAVISQEEKDLFEYAANVGGYRSLTDFMITSAHESARKIVEKRNQILASEKDRETFFDALFNPPAPNEKLKGAALRHKELFG